MIAGEGWCRYRALGAEMPEMEVGRSRGTEAGLGRGAQAMTDRRSGARPPDPTRASADLARFEASVLPHLQAAYNLARFLSRDRDASEDIVQEALLRAFRSVGACRGVDARPWLLAIVRNCFRAWAEARRSRPVTVPLDACGRAPNGVGDLAGASISVRELWNSDDDTPESAAMRTSEIAAIRATIENLPEPFREVLVLRELEELSYREIADVTGVPMGTVMSRLTRARELFASAWQRRFGEINPGLYRSTGDAR
jgi:RNA polymerase sigma factor (sigma-70 family)